MYDSPNRNGGPSFTLGGKYDMNRTMNTPGPGNYYASNANKDRALAYSMGKGGNRSHSRSYS